MCKKIYLFMIALSCLIGVDVARAYVPVLGIMQTKKDLAKVKSHIYGMNIEKVVIDAQESEDNPISKIQRKALLLRRKDAVGTVIICHGYLSNKYDAFHLKHLFPYYNVLSFDFRAHGENTKGQVSTIGRDEAFDVIGAVNFVKSDEKMKNLPVVGYGFSMGAVSLIEAAARNDKLFDALILDCPYDSTDKGVRRGLDKKMKMSILGREFNLPGKEFILNHLYDEKWSRVIKVLFKMITSLDANKVPTKFVRVTPEDSVRKITIPCFFIHCENDKKVPVAAVQSLYKNVHGFKRMWITRGRKHFGSYVDYPEMYWYKVNRFLEKVFDGHIDKRRKANVHDDRAIITDA